MYTSGSTGGSKGVEVEHGGIVRIVKDRGLGLRDSEGFLQLSPVTFDASTLEIWGALVNGGELVVQGREKPGLKELGESVKGEGVTVLWLTSGLFHQMVEEELEQLQGVRQLLSGGDVVEVEDVRKARGVLKER